MRGFVVTTSPGGGDVKIEVSAVDTVSTDAGHKVLIDGAALGIAPERLATALVNHEDELLRDVHGNYSALIIAPDGSMEGACDRFGAKSIYWQTRANDDLVVSSRWDTMPKPDRQWDPVGVSQALRFRWTSEQRTMLAAISRLPHWHRVEFARDGTTTVHETTQAPRWSTERSEQSFAEKLDETRSALDQSVAELAECHDNVAIFLSGGVDSSLLAALSKRYFRNCLLISTVFPDGYNDELEAARSYAQILGLEHRLVEFDESRVADDLVRLVRANGGQVYFHALAIHQMLAALPDAYRLVLYGEGADALFGSNILSLSRKYLRWKRQSEKFPPVLLDLAAALPSQRFKRTAHLLQRPPEDVALQHHQIQYPEESQAIIDEICDESLDDTCSYRAIGDYLEGKSGRYRNVLQDLTFRTEGANHFKQTETSAEMFGKAIAKPYLSRPVIRVARNLSDDQYFGTQHRKPVLRALAAEHFGDELAYAPKRGFNVPAVSWLQGPLAPFVERVRDERTLFDGRKLDRLDMKTHYSLYWTLMCWKVLDEQLQESAA